MNISTQTGPFFIFVGIIVLIRITEGNYVNEKAKEMVKQSGCPFVSTNQLLVRNVCLLPDYQPNELPKNSEGKVNIQINLHKAFILEVDELRNRLTLKIVQFLKWYDPRIKTNYSAIDDPSGIIWLSQNNVQQIWHPDQDMYTEDLEEWKSLYDPSLYRKVVVLPHYDLGEINDYVRDTNLDDDYEGEKHEKDTPTHLGGLKAWRATILCIFDFSSYPLDTQRCTFTQFGVIGMNITLNTAGEPSEWTQKVAGFNVAIENVGSNGNDSIGFDITLKRIVQPYLYQYYLPCISIVVVAQVSFIIPLNAIPGRVALVATQFLTLTNIFIHQIADSPSGANLNALGFYLLVSLFFVIGTTIELAIVLMIKRIKRKGKYNRHPRNHSANSSMKMDSATGMNNFWNERSPKKHFSTIPKTTQNKPNAAPFPPKSTSYETIIRGPSASLVVMNTNELLEKQPMITTSALPASNPQSNDSFSTSYNITDKIDFAALVLFLSLYIIFNCLYVIKYL